MVSRTLAVPERDTTVPLRQLAGGTFCETGSFLLKKGKRPKIKRVRLLKRRRRLKKGQMLGNTPPLEASHDALRSATVRPACLLSLYLKTIEAARAECEQNSYYPSPGLHLQSQALISPKGLQAAIP